MMEHICNSHYAGGIGRRITIQAGLGKNMKPILKSKRG
jgi:hypothetical protein